MKSINRILIVSLSIIILSINIATFAIKPIQARAAVAVPVVAVGSVIWDLLITAFVAAGVHDIVNDYDKQKMVYDNFLKSVKVLDPPLPDSPPDISFPAWDVEDQWVGMILSRDFVNSITGHTPPTQNTDPPDNNSWKGLPPIDFVLGASMLAKVTTYVADLWADNTSDLHTSVFGSSSPNKWTGEYDMEAGNYSYNYNYFTNPKLGYKGEITYYKIQISDTGIPFLAKYQIVGVLDPSNTIISMYKLDINGNFVSVLDFYGYYYEIRASDEKILRHGQMSHPRLENFNGNFPVFYTMKSAESFLRGQAVPDSEYVNMAEKKPYIPNFSTSVPNLPSVLHPLIRPDVTKPLSTGTLVDAVTDFEIKLKPELEKATETGTTLDTPTYDKIFSDSLNDAITKTETETKPDPPVTKPDVEQGNPDDLLADLKSVFPFCIPFDLIHAFSVFQADAKPPRFELPLKALKYGIDYTFVIDLEIFDPVAKIFRTCETISFIVGLILVTRKLIKG